jgi:hypothetical protein
MIDRTPRRPGVLAPRFRKSRPPQQKKAEQLKML